MMEGLDRSDRQEHGFDIKKEESSTSEKGRYTIKNLGRTDLVEVGGGTSFAKEDHV